MTNITTASLAQQAIDQIEALAAALAALGKEDLLSGERARAMCASLDDVVTGLLHCPADDTDANTWTPHEDDVCPGCGEAKPDYQSFCDTCNAEGDQTAIHYGATP